MKFCLVVGCCCDGKIYIVECVGKGVKNFNIINNIFRFMCDLMGGGFQVCLVVDNMQVSKFYGFYSLGGCVNIFCFGGSDKNNCDMYFIIFFD